MPTSPPRVLYHYTSSKALASILAEMQLRPSLLGTRASDVRYGEGQYFTDIPPRRLTAKKLSNVLLRHPFAAHRFTHFLAVDVTGLEVIRGRAGIFLVPNRQALDLANRIIQTGANAHDLP